jgi:hypothetical protein
VTTQETFYETINIGNLEFNALPIVPLFHFSIIPTGLVLQGKYFL